jgi:hypothetical protein
MLASAEIDRNSTISVLRWRSHRHWPADLDPQPVTRHVKRIMPDRYRLEIDMRPDGSFREPVKPPLAARIFFWAILVATITGAVVIAALALWVALALIPLAIGAAIVAYLAFRFQLWRSGVSLRDRGARGRR